MNEQAVISCPQCLRQYEVDVTSDRLVAQCSACKAYFVLIIPRLVAPAEDALVLEKEIEPSINFFEEGCEAMAKHACAWMAGQGDAISPSSLLAFIEKITSDEICERIRWSFNT